MIDPGAIGTLVIGLQATDQEYRFEDEPPRWVRESTADDWTDDSWTPPIGRLDRLRSTSAGALRKFADWLEPRTIEAGPIGGA